jgi:hypothetical protein
VKGKGSCVKHLVEAMGRALFIATLLVSMGTLTLCNLLKAKSCDIESHVFTSKITCSSNNPE